jgi:hypothetical protein
MKKVRAGKTGKVELKAEVGESYLIAGHKTPPIQASFPAHCAMPTAGLNNFFFCRFRFLLLS